MAQPEWLPFCRRRFRMHFCERKCACFYSNSTEAHLFETKGLISRTIFRNSNSILLSSMLSCSDRYESFAHGTTAVACRKFCSDIKPYNGVTVKPTFHRILITMEKSFVRCSWSNATLPYCTRTEPVYTARPAQNGGHFADNVMCIF